MNTSHLSSAERLNFLLTNRLPRRWLTLAMGRFSRIENPFIARASIGAWRLFVDDLRLQEAKKQHFDSLHDCFTRELKPGARPVDDDPAVLTSPCDAVIGEFGRLEGIEAIQAKGFPYSIEELLSDEALAERYRDGNFVTLRLKSSMYHRFHAPLDCSLGKVIYISGDTWNVNPVALKVVQRLFCKNERVVFDLSPQRAGGQITLVAVAAILVASVVIHGVEEPLSLEYAGPNNMHLDRTYDKGEEMGYFQHGSTIVLFSTSEYRFCKGCRTGEIIRMGQPLMRQT